ncbi:MAG TPA: phosphatase PAP2 family protein [Bryobacteraceae bacterium]|nr:phosphatase PAP2 family protein [Bryobacteraceae bacterium]
MKTLLTVLCCAAAAISNQAALGQTAPAEGQNSSVSSSAADQEQASATGTEQNKSVLGVAPGTEAIKNKDLFEATGYWHPFVRMPKFILVDQEWIWTSPFRTSRENVKWWLIFGAATAGLIAADQHIAKAAPNNSTLQTLGNDVSHLGDPYTLIPIAGAFYLVGSHNGDERFREAGMLSFETLIDVTVVQLAVKSITDRERPNEGSGEGHFWASTSSRYNSSFPSGHAIETFALASVFAHEYHDKLWVKLLAYAYAGGVVGARLAANKHFPGDVMAGGAMGWFIGDYVYGKRHNPRLDDKRTMLQKVLAHVEIGGPAW